MQKCPGRRWAGVASVIVPSLTWQLTNLTLEVNLLTNLHQKFSQSTCLQTSSFTRLFCPFHVKCTSPWIAHERSNFHFVLCGPCRLAHRVSSTPLQTPRICLFIPAPSFLIKYFTAISYLPVLITAHASLPSISHWQSSHLLTICKERPGAPRSC
jgi:hypothetical protein